jgi:phosphoesterase RecJ-like protein
MNSWETFEASASQPTLDSRAPEPDSQDKELAWNSAVELIQQAADILVICHVSPDGDAIGSLLGLGLALRTLEKNSTLACESSLPQKFGFLPGFHSVVNEIESPRFDLVIGLDSSDPLRLGNVYDAEKLAGLPLINIDHHITNLYYGDVDVVDPTAASTAEMIVTLLDYLNVPLGTEAVPGLATCLLTGIVTDTLGFRTSNVTKRVIASALRLMEAGASLSQVTHFAFHQRPLAELNLLARGLGRVQAEDGLAWSEISLDDLKVYGDGRNGDAGLVGMLARTKEVHMAAVFTEKEGNRVEIGFRADPGFDVSQIALSLGGGGHPAASGCTIEGPLDAAKARVLPMMRAALAEQLASKKS